MKAPNNACQLPNGWIVSLEEVTPEKAQEWLDKHNVANRKMRATHVKRLALLMQNGEFDTTPQGIAFGTTGRLLDGQHRLKGIVTTGLTQTLLVIRNVGDNLFSKVDQGAKRNLVDVLGTDRRLQDPITALARLHFRRQPTPEEARTILDAFGPTLSYLLDVCGNAVKVRSSAPVRAAVTLRMVAHPAHQEELAQWYRGFVNMDFAALPPSLLALIRQADAGKLSLGGGTGRQDALLRAWAAFDPHNTDRSKIQLTSPENITAEMRDVIAKALHVREAA